MKQKVFIHPESRIKNETEYFSSSRLKSLNDGLDSLSQYTNGFGGEQEFVAQTQSKINAQLPSVSSLEDAKRSVQPAMVSGDQSCNEGHIGNSHKMGQYFNLKNWKKLKIQTSPTAVAVPITE